MKSGYVPLKGSGRRNGGGLKGRQAAKYNFLKLRNMEEILSTKYRHLLSCELRSQLRRWRYSLDRISSSFRSFKKIYNSLSKPTCRPKLPLFLSPGQHVRKHFLVYKLLFTQLSYNLIYKLSISFSLKLTHNAFHYHSFILCSHRICEFCCYDFSYFIL